MFTYKEKNHEYGSGFHIFDTIKDMIEKLYEWNGDFCHINLGHLDVDYEVKQILENYKNHLFISTQNDFFVVPEGDNAFRVIATQLSHPTLNFYELKEVEDILDNEYYIVYNKNIIKTMKGNQIKDESYIFKPILIKEDTSSVAFPL